MDWTWKRFWRMFVRRIGWVLLIALLGAGAAGWYAETNVQPQYQASAKVVVNHFKASGSSTLSAPDIAASIQLIATYKELLKSEWIMADVAQAHPEFGLTAAGILKKLKVGSTSGTQVMTFTVTDPDYGNAARIVNAVTAAFLQKAPQLLKVDNLEVLLLADENARPAAKSTGAAVYGAATGIVLAAVSLVIFILLERTDRSVRTEEQLEAIAGLPVLATIPAFATSRKRTQRAKSQQASHEQLQLPS